MMEITKSIPELFFDRMIAEGATLHIWFRGTRFVRMTTKIKVCGTVHDRTMDEQNLWGFEKFAPSDDLSAVYRRNAASIQAWLDQKRVEWCRECGVEP